jgi:hypothetical protein
MSDGEDRSRNRFLERELKGQWIPGHGFDCTYYSTDADPIDDDVLVRLLIEKLEDEGKRYSRWHNGAGDVIHRFECELPVEDGLTRFRATAKHKPRDNDAESRAIVDAAMTLRCAEGSEATRASPPPGEATDACNASKTSIQSVR